MIFQDTYKAATCRWEPGAPVAVYSLIRGAVGRHWGVPLPEEASGLCSRWTGRRITLGILFLSRYGANPLHHELDAIDRLSASRAPLAESENGSSRRIASPELGRSLELTWPTPGAASARHVRHLTGNGGAFTPPRKRPAPPVPWLLGGGARHVSGGSRWGLPSPFLS